jgi:uncharacterized protein YbjT (DUF2867 family)
MILVTGGTGFIGPHVIRALRGRDLPVRALVRSGRGTTGLEELGVELAEGDMTDAASVQRAVDGCDTVVHLVAILTGRRIEFEQIMEQGTRDLIGAAKEAGVRRWVQMSALGTSEQSKDLVPYFHAKWTMEQDLKASGLEHVIFRPSFVFGREGGILPTFKRLARLTPVTPIAGKGGQRIQPIWVDDVAAYFAAAIDKPEVANRSFDLGGPDVVTWNEFWEQLKRALRIRRPSLHVPMGLMRIQATAMERLPNPPVTRDLLKMLEAGDNVVSSNDAVEVFELPLVDLESQLRRAA